jgi:glucitol operon activator protein
LWGVIILIFVGLWGLQIGLTYFQSKHYKETLSEMSNRPSGFLGVGVVKQKLGVGSVIILTCDQEGKITEAREMSGVTVFARFKPASQLIGHSIELHEQEMENPNNRMKAITMAISNIRKQMEKVA